MDILIQTFFYDEMNCTSW